MRLRIYFTRITSQPIWRRRCVKKAPFEHRTYFACDRPHKRVVFMRKIPYQRPSFSSFIVIYYVCESMAFVFFFGTVRVEVALFLSYCGDRRLGLWLFTVPWAARQLFTKYVWRLTLFWIWKNQWSKHQTALHRKTTSNAYL